MWLVNLLVLYMASVSKSFTKKIVFEYILFLVSTSMQHKNFSFLRTVFVRSK